MRSISEEEPYETSDVKACVRAYMEARRRSSLSREFLDSEAKKLFSYFREYVQSKKGEQVQSFSDLIEDFYSEVLGLDVVRIKELEVPLLGGSRVGKDIMLAILGIEESWTSFTPKIVGIEDYNFKTALMYSTISLLLTGFNETVSPFLWGRI